MTTYHSPQALDAHQEAYRKYCLFAVAVCEDDCAPGPTRTNKEMKL